MKINEMFKPKTEKEIWNDLSNLPPDKMLIACASVGLLTGVQIALDKGADINALSDYDESSALASASLKGHHEIVHYLLGRKALVCNLALIGIFDIPDMFKLMLQEADIEYCCGLEFALIIAEEQKRTEVVSLIRERIKLG